MTGLFFADSMFFLASFGLAYTTKLTDQVIFENIFSCSGDHRCFKPFRFSSGHQLWERCDIQGHLCRFLGKRSLGVGLLSPPVVWQWL